MVVLQQHRDNGGSFNSSSSSNNNNNNNGCCHFDVSAVRSVGRRLTSGRLLYARRWSMEVLIIRHAEGTLNTPTLFN